MGCERRTLAESAMRGARVRLELPNNVSARPDTWFLSDSNMSVQGAAAATSIMSMRPPPPPPPFSSLPLQTLQENQHAKDGGAGRGASAISTEEPVKPKCHQACNLTVFMGAKVQTVFFYLCSFSPNKNVTFHPGTVPDQNCYSKTTSLNLI